ncbi:MAG: rhomboid family intramembrane serine protease [Clostridia bacterium]|nr:rhomboid family intramembrane serine protease [Clostridia bacterium]
MLDKLQRKLGRYAIRNLMTIITIGMAAVYVLDTFFSVFFGGALSNLLYFNPYMILHGQIWRLVTFIFVPMRGSLLTMALSLYFYWMIGSALEQQWGTFRFNAFYLCGMLCTIIGGFITGYADASWLNMSMFLAFALMWPDFEVLLFFILPVKMKWLALLDAVLLVTSALRGGFSGIILLVMSLLNLALFFGKDAIDKAKYAYRRYKWKQNWKK